MVRGGNQGRSGTTARSIRVIAAALRGVLLLIACKYAVLGKAAPAEISMLDKVRSLDIQAQQPQNVNRIQPNTGERSRAGTPAMSSLWDSTPVPVTVKPPEQHATAPERTPSVNPLWNIPLATLSGTRERPIFSSSRRPRPPAVEAVPIANAPAPPPAKAEHPHLWLLGTVADGDQGFGIFVDQNTKGALRLKIGEEAQGWKLRSVRGREVALERQQQIVILSLPEPGADPAGQTRVQAWNAGILQGAADLQSVLREREGRR
jgi:general secretion pathway protein N